MISTKKYIGSIGFSYARFSDPTQGAGHSIERQESYAPSFCEEFGLTLNTTLSFRDEGRSAFKGEHLSQRGELQRFLACIEAGYVKAGDFLIVENLDRLSRLELSAAEQLLHSILSKGVRIHTRSPWAIYDKRTLNNPMERMQMIFEFTRSHRESRAKQERLSRRWEYNRTNIRVGKYHLSTLPGWLELADKKDKSKGYKTIAEHVVTVRRVFQLCVEGLGLNLIAKRLNESKTPTLGRGEYWQRSSISKLLHNRAVLGEYQPFTSVKFDDDNREFQNTKRIPIGDPIANHFPAIIEKQLFENAALALTKRQSTQGGRNTNQPSIVNLFAGMIYDVRDGSKMHVVDKGDGPRLISNKSKSGASDGVTMYVPYAMIEQAFVAFVDEMPLAMLVPKADKKNEAKLVGLQKDIDSLKLQVEQIKAKTRKNHSDVLLELLVERDAELKYKQAEFEQADRQRGSTQSMAASSSKSILKHLSEAKGVELATLRTKLRNELRYWIKRIDILPLNLSGIRAAVVDVELQSGKRFAFRASRELIDFPSQLDGRDITQFRKWPKSAQQTNWQVEKDIDRQIRELDDLKHSVTEIATKLELSPTNVSRKLIAMGRRKRPRKSIDSEQLMTWHAAGCGWVKRKDGKRYFVGVGKLKDLYPKLIKSSDKDGSMKAANKWWTQHGPNS